MNKIRLLSTIFILGLTTTLTGCEQAQQTENTVIDENLYVDHSNTYEYLACVSNAESLYGFISEYGYEIIPCEYTFADEFHANGVVRVAKSDHQWGYINTTGKEVVPLKYDKACYSAGSLLGVAKENNDSTYSWAFFNCNGEQVTDFEYQYESEPFSWESCDKFMIVSKKSNITDPNDSLTYNYGIINENGEEVIPIGNQLIDNTQPMGESGLIAVGRKQSDSSIKYGYLNFQNEVVIPFEYEEAHNFTDNGLAAVKKDGLWGYIDTSGNIKINFQYEEISDFANNGLAFVKNNSSSYINENGDVILSGDWNLGTKFDDYNYALVQTSTGENIINENGQLLLPYQADNIFYFSGKITTNNSSALLNYKGEILLERNDGQSLTAFGDNDIAIVKSINGESEDSIFFIDRHGEITEPPENITYKSISPFRRVCETFSVNS